MDFPEPIRRREADVVKSSGAVEALEETLNSLEDAIERVEHKVMSARSQYAVQHLSEPRAEPSNALRGRIERLQNNVTRLNQLAEEIDL
jgi:polyhydroxyalkanoate synthesis regulator phasin